MFFCTFISCFWRTANHQQHQLPRLCWAMVASWVVCLAAPLCAQHRNELIVQSGQGAPDGNGMFQSFRGQDLRFNDAGQVIFAAGLVETAGGTADDRGLFIFGNGSLTQVARADQLISPENIRLSGFVGIPQINSSGQVTFRANLSDSNGAAGQAVFRSTGGNLAEIARTGSVAPDENGSFSILQDGSINNSGQVFFRATLTNTIGEFDNQGIFLGDEGGLTQLFRTGTAAPDGNGTFSSVGALQANNVGQYTFWSNFNGDVADRGLFLAGEDQSPIQQIARSGQVAPDGNGTFSNHVLGPQINNAGQVAFRARFDGTDNPNTDSGILLYSDGVLTQLVRTGQDAPGGGIFDLVSSVNTNLQLSDTGYVAFRSQLVGSVGIFRANEAGVVQIARQGQDTPDGNGRFNTLGQRTFNLNDSGQVVFFSTLVGTDGGSADNSGMFTGDGIDLIQIARKGDLFDGSTISDWRVQGANNFGQVGWQGFLADGREVLNLWTPDLHWRNATGGSWETTGAWTLGLTPAHVHDVFINPDSNLTVFGPNTDTVVRSLQIGGGSGEATLHLTNGVNLTASDGLMIASNGELTGQGTITGDVTSLGTIRPGDSAGILSIVGNLMLDSTSDLFIELGGLQAGQFDQLVVSGDMNLAGNLFVDLIDSHTLGLNQTYLIGEVGGLLSGQFTGLGEGDLVGTFGGTDLFISYSMGSGNSIGLFTAIPEPGSAGLLAALLGLFALQRRRGTGKS